MKKGSKQTPESILKMSEAHKKALDNPEVRKRMSEAHKGKHPSEETLRKRSESMKGKNKYKRTEETRRKLSEAHKGKPSWNKGMKGYGKGHIVSEETKKKIGLAHKGKTLSEEHRRKLSLSHLGIKYPNRRYSSEQGFQKGHKLNLGRHFPKEFGMKIVATRRKNDSYKHSEESIKKQKESLKKTWSNPELRKRHSEMFRGEKSSLWKGGISFEPYSPDWTRALKQVIRERDNYTCQLCGKKGMSVHHIDYDKKNCNPENLIILCTNCHSKTNSNREKWKKFFKEKD